MVLTCPGPHAGRMRHRGCVPGVLAAVVVVLGLSACSSGGGTPAAEARPSVGASPAEAGAAGAAGGEKTGGETSIPFTNPTLRWSIAAPGSMSAQGGDGSYVGKSDHLTVTALPAGGDPQALARADAAGTGVAGFALVQPPHQAPIAGVNATVLEFTKDDVVNPVTKKAQTAHVFRAYVAGPQRLFRLEYGATVPADSWDPQGALDIVSTFRTAA